MTRSLLDTYHRQIDYMRISVTDLCNLRCVYCSSSEFEHLSHEDILRYEEIERVVRSAAALGISNIRLTGGEPTVRPGVTDLIRILKAVPGIEEISMTTNAIRLTQMAKELKEAGLSRVNISLDTFKPERFERMCGVPALPDVLAGIEAARQAGLNPVKTNTVVLRGINEDEINDFARRTLTDNWHVRFIEEMPLVKDDDGHKMVSISEIKERIEREFGELLPSRTANGHGPARYFRIAGAEGTIGFIAPVTDCFCKECNRFRLTADGKLRPCLLRDDEVDLKPALRGGASDSELQKLLLDTATLKYERHQLAESIAPSGRNMRQIGG
ncbi:MAG: GTP 3',8-cyclase MoaA [Dehalococcoidia bacterium]|nr:GTP 3',8-cyclase MoaA [Dehalococcoidia bacterium]